MPASPTDALAARIEATFGTAAPLIRRFALLAAAVMAFAFLLNTVKMVIEINAPGFDGQATRIDFTAFWAAAKLALAGDAVSAFDPNALRAAQQLPSGQTPGDLLWLYPPAWHIVIMPLGLLPFTAAYIVYSAVTIAAFALALRPLAAPLPGGVPLVLAGPAVLIILLLGNNSLLWTAGLVAALAMLAQGRMMLAGLLIALLTLKPQLGLLIPFALAFGGYWRTVLWACAGTAFIAAASTVAMGIDYWGHFFTMLRFMSDLMQTEMVRFERMMTWYALARLGGAGHGIAFGLQLAVAAAAAAAVAWVWSRKSATTDIKAATLCIAIPLATPYAYHYEMTLTLAAAMFLARDGFGAGRAERLWLLALWLGPVPALALLGLLPPAVYAAPLLTATLLICLIRVWRQPGADGPGIAAGPGIRAARLFDISATILFWAGGLYALSILFVSLVGLSGQNPYGSFPIDFGIFWAAAKLAASGHPFAAFDHNALFAATGLPPDRYSDNILWLYPATFMLALMPLGTVSFIYAYPAFLAVSATAFGLAVRAPAAVAPGLWRLMLISPTVVIGCLLPGQTGVLWAAGLAASLWAVQRGHAVTAGLFIALLTMKPQLGLLIPVALIAARQWAVIGWATAFTLLLTGVATAVFGTAYWPLFLAAMNDVGGRVADGTAPLIGMVTPYGFARALGIGHGVALAGQLVLTAFLVMITGWVWSRRGVTIDLKCATLCAAIPLATPYALFYEMPIELVAALFLIRDGFGRRLAEKLWLLVLWFGPAQGIFFPETFYMPIYNPPLLLVTFLICLTRLQKQPTGAGAVKCRCPEV